LPPWHVPLKERIRHISAHACREIKKAGERNSGDHGHQRNEGPARILSAHTMLTRPCVPDLTLLTGLSLPVLSITCPRWE
jgi:hypothetical protein